MGKEELRLNVLKLLLILCILIFASVTDFRKREVPNIYIILIILTALIDFRALNMLGNVSTGIVASILIATIVTFIFKVKD